MLSRRFLRIKVMQTLYALKQTENANFGLALDQIAEAFKPDLNSMQKQNLQELEGLRKLAVLVFEEKVSGRISDETVPPKAEVTATEAVRAYTSANQAAQRRMFRNMIDEPNHVLNTYLKMLLCLLEIGDEATLSDGRSEFDEDGQERSKYATAGFSDNRFIQSLQKNPELKTESIRRNLNWDADRLMLRKFFKDTLRTDEIFAEYCQKTNHSVEEDKNIVWHIFNTHILRDEEVGGYFEKKDLFWNENADVIHGMMKRTLKVFEETGEAKIQPLSPSFDDDSVFFEDLYKATTDADSELMELLVNQVQNWDIERIALTDQILLKMALAEMMNFSSIPVKVTINEYIELAKEYSTPKSGQFLNGVLDVLSAKLQKTGKIRKSGRGLIDNK